MKPKSLRKQARELRARVERIMTATPKDRRDYISHVAPLMDAAYHLNAAAYAMEVVAELDKDLHPELPE